MTQRAPKPLAALLAAVSLAILYVGFISLESDAADKKGAKKGSKALAEAETPVVDLDPEGVPPGNDARVDTPRIFLWYDAGQWHIRTRTKKDSHEFSGVIDIKGGKVKKITNFEGLEDARKKSGKIAKNKDLGRWNSARNKIEFKFRTHGAEDGFDFELDNDATELAFDLKINGYGHGKIIRVGGKGQIPEAPKFTLPARPRTAESEEAAKPK